MIGFIRPSKPQFPVRPLEQLGVFMGTTKYGSSIVLDRIWISVQILTLNTYCIMLLFPDIILG